MFSIAGKIIFPIFAGPLMTEPTNKIYEQDPHSRVPQLSQYAGPPRRHPLRGARENQKRRVLRQRTLNYRKAVSANLPF